MTSVLPVSSPWKPCDLRGLYPESVSEDLFFKVGSAIGTTLPPHARILICGDFRPSTSTLKQALSDGLLRTGGSVIDAGHGPTPLAYYAAERCAADAVLMVTASHNPPGYNGLKLMVGGVPTTPEALLRIRSLVDAESFRSGRGRYETVDVQADYQESAALRWRHLDPLRHPRIALDAGNGAWSELAPAIFQRLGFEVDCISCVPDGTFPDRPSDCSRPENLDRLRQTIKTRDRAIGFAWDGDGDRLAVIDETGDFVSADELSMLFARFLLERNAGADASQRKVVIDIKFSDAVRRSVLQYGGVPLLERTGHAFMRGRMVAESALLGLDACGHYFHRELSGGDDGLFSALLVLDMLQSSASSLDHLRKALPPIFTTPDLRIPLHHISYLAAAEQLRSAFPDATIETLDGLRFVFEDGVVLIRPSGTEPVISLRIEGFEQMAFDRILSQSLSALSEVAASLERQLQGGAS